MTKTEPHITELKRNEVEDIKKLYSEYKVMGIVNLSNLPAFNYMKILHSLKGKVVLKYTKRRLMKIAFDEIKDQKLEPLKDRLTGIPALIFTNEESFRLAQILRKSKSNAPAKPGDEAPTNIVIPEGPTDFAPGPMIGELGALGIKTQVVEGKIHIKGEKLLVEAGKEINAKNAELMSKLKMEPMEIGLNLVLTYHEGEVLEGIVLNIDPEEYENNLKTAAGESMALAMSLGYISKDTIVPLIGKASLEGESLVTVSKFSEAEMETPKEEVKEETKEEVKEEPKVEETPAEEEVVEEKEEESEEETEEDSDDEAEDTEEEPVPNEENKKEDNNIPEHVEKEVEEEIKEENTDTVDKEVKKEEVKGVNDISDDDIKKAQDQLKSLTDKKIRGEI